MGYGNVSANSLPGRPQIHKVPWPVSTKTLTPSSSTGTMCFTGKHGKLPRVAWGGWAAEVLYTEVSIAASLGYRAHRLQEPASPSTLLALMLLRFSPGIAITEFLNANINNTQYFMFSSGFSLNYCLFKSPVLFKRSESDSSGDVCFKSCCLVNDGSGPWIQIWFCSHFDLPCEWTWEFSP